MKRRTFVSSAISAGAMALLPARQVLASTADTPAIGRTGKQLVLRGRYIAAAPRNLSCDRARCFRGLRMGPATGAH